jgi:hypothetical protein
MQRLSHRYRTSYSTNAFDYRSTKHLLHPRLSSTLMRSIGLVAFRRVASIAALSVTRAQMDSSRFIVSRHPGFCQPTKRLRAPSLSRPALGSSSRSAVDCTSEKVRRLSTAGT